VRSGYLQSRNFWKPLPLYIRLQPSNRIYNLEKQVHKTDGHTWTEIESTPLLDMSVDTDTIFRRALDAELEKICSFYQIQELSTFGEVEETLNDAAAYIADTDGIDMDPVGEIAIKARRFSFGSRRRSGSIFQTLGLRRARRESTVSGTIEAEEEDDDSDDDANLDSSISDPQTVSRSNAAHRDLMDRSDGHTSEVGDSRILGDSRTWGPGSRSVLYDDDFADPRFLDLYNAGVSLKKRVVGVYVPLCELKSYIQLNKTGFSKALKKYDKTIDRSLRRPYMNDTVSTAYPFTDSTTQHLDENIAKVEHVYADIVTKGNFRLAQRELRLHLREHVVWERNTVWREMIGIERKAQAANMGIRRTLLGGDEDPEAAQRQGDELKIRTVELRTPIFRCLVPDWLLSLSLSTLLIVVTIFIALLSVPITKSPEQQNCLAMLIFVSLLWATEVNCLFLRRV
jgi:phosphate transporter